MDSLPAHTHVLHRTYSRTCCPTRIAAHLPITFNISQVTYTLAPRLYFRVTQLAGLFHAPYLQNISSQPSTKRAFTKQTRSNKHPTHQNKKHSKKTRAPIKTHTSSNPPFPLLPPPHRRHSFRTDYLGHARRETARVCVLSTLTSDTMAATARTSNCTAAASCMSSADTSVSVELSCSGLSSVRL